MMRVAIDTETELLEAGHVAPRMACMTVARPDKPTQIFGRMAAPAIIRSYLEDAESLVIGHNIMFDLGVLGTQDESLVRPIFQALADGRVRETMVREALILIRRGLSIDDKQPHLDDLAQQYLGYALDKGEDSARYWYGRLIDVPVDQWSEKERDYAMRDARATLEVFDAQQREPGNRPANSDFHGRFPDSTVSPDEVLQTRAAWVLHLMRMWGFRTDGEMVALIERDLERVCAEAEARMLEVGIYKDERSQRAIREGRPPKIVQKKAVVAQRVNAYFQSIGKQPPLTEGAAKAQASGTVLEGDALLKYVSCARDILESTDDPDLHALAAVGPAEKALGTFIPLVKAGTKHPVIVRWNPLVRTGRTSCGDSGNDEIGNWQNPAKRPGIRESVLARPGCVFVSWDYALAELCSLSQTCFEWFGASDMRDAIIEGKDLHLILGCNSQTLLGSLMDYAEAFRIKNDPLDPQYDLVDKRRQTAKNTNFGFPGGMGPATFIQNCWQTSRVRVSLEEATALKRDWLRTWREMPLYFDRIAREDDAGIPAVQCLTERVRGFQRGEFCARANTYFQGRTADGAKIGGWKIAWECFADESSPLFGFRPMLFVHDQWVVEGPEERAHEAAERGREVLKAAMAIITPDVPATLDMALSRRWFKKAKEVRDKNGRLIPWEPRCSHELAPKQRCGAVCGPLDKLCAQHKKEK